MLSTIMLIVILLSVIVLHTILLIVIILNAIMLCCYDGCHCVVLLC